MRCDGSPDPSVQTEINSFITLWREDSETQIQRDLEKCTLALQVRPGFWIILVYYIRTAYFLEISFAQLTDELDFLLSDSPEPCAAQQYRETLLTLQKLIHVKLDKATKEILKVRVLPFHKTQLNSILSQI